MLEISIHPYQSDWKNKFLKEKSALEYILNSYSAEIQHIGSTSVPGLASKNVIDILIQLESFPATNKELSEQLANLEYRRKNVFSLKKYLYYTRGDRLEGYHLHITSKEHPQAQVHLQFRDILRNNESIREEYASTKQELSTRYATDRASYRQEKRFFIQETLEKYSSLDPVLIYQSQNSYIK